MKTDVWLSDISFVVVIFWVFLRFLWLDVLLSRVSVWFAAADADRFARKLWRLGCFGSFFAVVAWLGENPDHWRFGGWDGVTYFVLLPAAC